MLLRAAIALALLGVVVALARAYAAARSRPVDALSLPPLETDLWKGNATWVVFTTPYCATCGPVKERITRLDPTADLVEVDVATRPDLADRYAVRTAPTVLFAAANGRVQARFVGNVPEHELQTARD